MELERVALSLSLPSLSYLHFSDICSFTFIQIYLRGQTSWKVTHPHTTPARARLTLEFYPTPAPPHFTGTCWYIYHINPIKPCWCLGLCSCSWVWWNFEKLFQTSVHITYHILKKKFQKKVFLKPIFFLLLVAHLANGAPLVSLQFFEFFCL